MLRGRHVGKRGRTRLLWLVILGLGLAGAIWGLYELYTLRTRQNTRKLLERAEAAAAEEDWDNAVIAYRQYLVREPEDSEALEAYSDVLLQKMRTTPEIVGDAVRTLRRLVGMKPDNTKAVGNLAGLYLSLREYGLAEELAGSWVALDPSSAEAAVGLALAQHRLHRSRQAADTLVAAITRNPDEPRLYPLLVRLLVEELNQPEEGKRRLDEALRIGPELPAVQLAAFTFHHSLGDLKAAEKYLHQALNLAPDSLDTLLTAAKFHLSCGRLDEADKLLGDARRIAPQDRGVLSMRTSWAVKEGSSAALLATADELVTSAEDADPGFLAQAAELYLRAGALDRADECLAKIDSLPSVSERFDAHLETLKGARALLRGEPYSAIAHLRPALHRDSRNPWTTRLLAAAYAETGDLEAAVDLLERLSVAAPRNVGVQLQLAQLAWQRGRLGDVRGAIDLPPEANEGQRFRAKLIAVACDLLEAKRNASLLEEEEDWNKELERLAAAAPQDSAPLRWLMRCFVLAGKPGRAVDVLRRNTTDTETALRLGTELGILLLSEKLGDRALALSDDLIQRFPRAAAGHVLRVSALGSMGRLSEAAAHVDQCSLPDEAQGRLLEALGDAYLAADQTKPALEAIRQAAELLPRSVALRRKLIRQTTDLAEALERTAEIRGIEGDTGLCWRYESAEALLRLDPKEQSSARASELLDQCLARRPRWPSARLLLGYAHELRGEFSDAVEAYQTAIAQKPGLTAKPVAVRLIVLLKRLSRFAEADALLNALAAELPEDPDVLRFRTEQQIRRRDLNKALKSAERLLELKPDDPAWTVVTADLHLRVGNHARAEAIAQAGLARRPDSTSILWSLARALIGQQRDAEAVERVREAVTAQEDAPHYLLLAQVLARLDRQLEAAEAIARAQKLAPEDAAAWAACADFWGSIGRHERQIACARKAIELRGEDPAQSLVLARLLAADGTADERAEATEIVRRCVTSNPEDAQALVLRGRLAVLETPPDLARAADDLSRALSIDPRAADAHRLLGLVQMRLGRFEAARETIKRGLGFTPHNPALLLASGEVHSALGDHRRAIVQLRQLLELVPRMPAALRLLANAYRATGRIEQAIAFVETQASGDIQAPAEMVIVAKLYEAKNDFEHATLLFQQAQAADESSSKTHQELLQFLARRESLEEIHTLAANRREQYPNDARSFAVAAEILGSQDGDVRLQEVGMEWLATIAREHPEHAADAVYRTALCHYRRGELPQAESKFLEAHRLAPGVQIVVNNLAWLYSEDLGKPTEAVALIGRFVEAGGIEDAHLLDTHGVALMRLGRFEAARQKLEQCLKAAGRTPTQTAATYHLGLTLMKTDRPDDALVQIRRAMELDERRGGLTPREKEQLPELLDQLTRPSRGL